jgi:hypothetical protein
MMNERKVLAARESGSLAKKAAEAAAAVAAVALEQEQQHEGTKEASPGWRIDLPWHCERNRKCEPQSVSE